MALIKCPNCGEEISDKAVKCPKCGAEFPVEKPQKVCKECGEILSDDETVCHKCGCPVEEKKEVVVANKKISLSKIIIAVVGGRRKFCHRISEFCTLAESVGVEAYFAVFRVLAYIFGES